MTVDAEQVREGTAAVRWGGLAGRVYIATVAALTSAVFLSVLAWSVVTPPLTTADEPRHFNSVLRLMQGGGWPDAQQAPMLEGTRVASAEAGDPIVGDPADPLPSRQDRSVVSGLDTPASPAQIDWMTQHPPGYYAVVAGTLTVLGADSWRWDELVQGMRTISALLAAAAIPFIAASVRRITGSRTAAIVGAAVPLAIPQYGHVLGLVTNDAMTTFLGAVLMYVAAHALIGMRRPFVLAILSGIVLGAALLTKGLMLAAIPMILVALLVGGWRSETRLWSRLGPAAVSMVVAFAVGGWWWLRNLIVYGELQPSVFGSGRDLEEPDAAYSPESFVFRVIGRLNRTLWGSFRPELDLSLTIELIAGTVAALSVIAALVFSRRRGVLLILAIYPLATFGIIAFHAWEIFWDNGTIRGIQGRYLYSALTLLAASVGVCWALVWTKAPGWLRALAGAVPVALAGALAVLGWRMAYDHLWGASGLASMGDVGAVSSTAFAVIAVAFAAVVTTSAAGTAVVAALDEPVTDDEEASDSGPVAVLER